MVQNCPLVFLDPKLAHQALHKGDVNDVLRGQQLGAEVTTKTKIIFIVKLESDYGSIGSIGKYKRLR
jgi:hypothetical protein